MTTSSQTINYSRAPASNNGSLLFNDQSQILSTPSSIIPLVILKFKN